MPNTAFLPVGQALCLSHMRDDTLRRMEELDDGMAAIVEMLHRQQQQIQALGMPVALIHPNCFSDDRRRAIAAEQNIRELQH